MLSHELRNPLAALSAAAHVLKLAHPNDAPAIKARGGGAPDEAHGAPRGRSARHAVLTMGKVGLERERFDLAEAVNNVVHIWRSSGRFDAPQRRRSIRPAWVDADWRAHRAGAVEPARQRGEVHARGQEDRRHRGAAGGSVLSVVDEGEGLPPESAERMFDLFVQGERGLDRAAGGLGIGLALVKRLTEMHGGTVAASSAGRGHGTSHGEAPAVPGDRARLYCLKAGLSALPRRVLIVEDNDDARAMLHETLAFNGHEVRAARDGASGLALAAELIPDIALIDIGLPDVDGYEVARACALRRADGRDSSRLPATGKRRPAPRLRRGIRCASHQACRARATQAGNGRTAMRAIFRRLARVRFLGESRLVNKRLLVVDDDADMRLTLKLALELAGYGVDVAGNARAALELAAPAARRRADHRHFHARRRRLRGDRRVPQEFPATKIVVVSGGAHQAKLPARRGA